MKKFTQGATLIEVMVSVFLLTFGILALMAAQIRSVSNISEAESQNTVAQAAESLAEAMQTNPTLTLLNNQTYKRRYNNYLTQAKAPKQQGAIANIATDKVINKQGLAALHIQEFEQILLNQMPHSNIIRYAICQDKAQPDAPTLSNGDAMDSKCAVAGNNSDITAIKIAWRTKNDANDVYTYILKVAD